MAPLSMCMKAASTFPKTAKEALRALGAAAQHKAFGLVLLQTQGVVSWPCRLRSIFSCYCRRMRW